MAATPGIPGYYDNVPTYAGPVFSSSPRYFYPATDRDRAITKLSMLAGDVLKEPDSIEQIEAREYFTKVMNEDYDLRQATDYVKEILADPEGEERLYREVVVPNLMQHHRYHGGMHNYDKFNSPWFAFPERFVAYQRPSFATWHEWDNYFREGNWYYTWLFYATCFYTVCWFRRKTYAWSTFSMTVAKYARLSRRYYGKSFDKIPPTATYIRNELSKQAIVRKMAKDGRAWAVHVERDDWKSRTTGTPPKVLPEYKGDYPQSMCDANMFR